MASADEVEPDASRGPPSADNLDDHGTSPACLSNCAWLVILCISRVAAQVNSDISPRVPINSSRARQVSDDNIKLLHMY